MTGSPQYGQIFCEVNTYPPTVLLHLARVPWCTEKDILGTLCTDGRDDWRRNCIQGMRRRNRRRVRSRYGPVELRSLDKGRRNWLGASSSQKVTLTVYFKIVKVNCGSCGISLCGLSCGRPIARQHSSGYRDRLATVSENGFAEGQGSCSFSSSRSVSEEWIGSILEMPGCPKRGLGLARESVAGLGFR